MSRSAASRAGWRSFPSWLAVLGPAAALGCRDASGPARLPGERHFALASVDGRLLPVVLSVSYLFGGDSAVTWLTSARLVLHPDTTYALTIRVRETAPGVDSIRVVSSPGTYRLAGDTLHLCLGDCLESGGGEIPGSFESRTWYNIRVPLAAGGFTLPRVFTTGPGAAYRFVRD